MSNQMIAALRKAREFFAGADDPDSKAMVSQIDTAIASHRKPLVYVTVSGGVAEIEVEEPGSVLVLLYDYDDASHYADYPEEPVTWEQRRADAEAVEAERVKLEG